MTSSERPIEMRRGLQSGGGAELLELNLLTCHISRLVSHHSRLFTGFHRLPVRAKKKVQCIFFFCCVCCFRSSLLLLTLYRGTETPSRHQLPPRRLHSLTSNTSALIWLAELHWALSCTGRVCPVSVSTRTLTVLTSTVTAQRRSCSTGLNTTTYLQPREQIGKE